MTAVFTVVAGLLLLITFPGTAHAYLDPGTGAILIQGLIGGIVGGLFIIRMYWQKLKGFFFGTESKDQVDQEPSPDKKNPVKEG